MTSQMMTTTRTMLSPPQRIRSSLSHSRATTTTRTIWSNILRKTTPATTTITNNSRIQYDQGRKSIWTGNNDQAPADDAIRDKDDTFHSTIQQHSLSVPSPLKLIGLDSKVLEQAWRHDKVLMSRIDEARSSEFPKAVERLQKALSLALGARGSNGLFQECQIDLYGSSLTDLYCDKNCDVDVSYYLPQLQKLKDRLDQGETKPEKYKADFKRHIHVVKGRLTRLKGSRFRDIKAVARSGVRVPLIKACYRYADNPNTEDGSLWFDMTFNNHVAVRNSALLREYTKVDPVCKNLMLAVKKWAKDNQMYSAADGYLSSYTWVILVIFYLQQIGMLPNLQSEAMMKAVGFQPNWKEYSKNSIDGFNTAFVYWQRIQKKNVWQQPSDLQELPISILLFGFFHFLLTHGPNSSLTASIRTGTFHSSPLAPVSKRNSFFSIEDPFESFDSHSPRDLSSTLQENGEAQTWNLVKASEQYLKAALSSDDDDDNRKITIGEWWKNPGSSAGRGQSRGRSTSGSNIERR